MIHGVDLSTYQRGVKYADLGKIIGFGYAKATDAVKRGNIWVPFVDPMHSEHSVGMRAVGTPTGSYAFGHPSQDMAQCADFFIVNAWFDQLRPVIDMESLDNGHTPANAGTWAEAWCQYVADHTGTSPIIYASTSYTIEMIRQCPAVAARDFWIAAYPGDNVNPPDHMPKVPGLAPERVLAWQWTGEGSIVGVSGHVDRDIAPVIEPLYVQAPAIP